MSQTDLFDLTSARLARDHAMQCAADHAPVDWKQRMYELTVEIASHRPRFTSDDVFQLAFERGVETAPEPRAYGPVIMRAARAGVCQKANVAPVLCARKSRHAAPLTVWESLVCQVKEYAR